MELKCIRSVDVNQAIWNTGFTNTNRRSSYSRIKKTIYIWIFPAFLSAARDCYCVHLHIPPIDQWVSWETQLDPDSHVALLQLWSSARMESVRIYTHVRLQQPNTLFYKHSSILVWRSIRESRTLHWNLKYLLEQRLPLRNNGLNS